LFCGCYSYYQAAKFGMKSEMHIIVQIIDEQILDFHIQFSFPVCFLLHPTPGNTEFGKVCTIIGVNSFLLYRVNPTSIIATACEISCELYSHNVFSSFYHNTHCLVGYFHYIYAFCLNPDSQDSRIFRIGEVYTLSLQVVYFYFRSV